MRNTIRNLLLSALLLFASAGIVFAQFGQNKVQYQYTNWKSILTEHFEVYYPEGGYQIALVTGEYAEIAYRSLSSNLDFKLESDDRITIITHLSHNQFQQTNVSTESPEESVGGFTEYFKTRVVIPYEGNWEKYRHVVHHELTHAIMLRKYYGRGLQSVINGVSRMPLPLWYVEGLAEYQSRFGWEFEADMFLRDAILNEWLPPIDNFGGYLNYKGGQSVLVYIDETYGSDKVIDLINRVKNYRDFDRGVRSAIGIDVKTLSERWLKWWKTRMWKDIAKFQKPSEIGIPLTDHVKQDNFVNNAPAISPQGDRVAYLSDRSDYFDIWLLSTYDSKNIRRLVSGERTANFEELHWLQPGITWDPTGTYIAFGAKADGQDAIYIVDANTGKKISHFSFDLDGVYSPNWSPDGKLIAFQGWKNGMCDIYTVSVKDSVLHRITRDVYTDFEPNWRSDSQSLLFTSDRGKQLSVATDTVLDKSFAHRPVQSTEIYEVNIQTQQVKQLTFDGQVARSPIHIPSDSSFVYVSNISGINNLYRWNPKTHQAVALTNILTGLFQPSISYNQTLVFSSFFNGGYDIYMKPNALSALSSTPLETTEYRTDFPKPNTKHESIDTTTSWRVNQTSHFANYIFDDASGGKAPGSVTDSSHPKDPASETPRDYAIHMTPDLVFASAGYSNLSGFQGMGQFLLSDVLGNHIVYVSTDLYYDIENTNLNALYYYLPYRLDAGVGVFHNVYFFDYGWTRDRSYGISLETQYPISKYTRLDFSANFINIHRSRYTLDREDYVTLANRHVLLPGLSFVKDNSIWGYTGPANGERYRVSLYWSPDFDHNKPAYYGDKWGLDFKTATFDYRRYLRINHEYGFAFRVSGGASEGKSPQRFFLGGESNVLNRGAGNREFVGDVNDVFFSTVVTPLRGSDLYQQVGTRYGISNIEFRYPLIKLLALGWPLPAYFYNIRGATFIDVGGVWNKDQFRGSIAEPSGATRLKDMQMGFGFGARASLGFALLKYDIAWQSDWVHNYLPQHYISMGTEF